MDSWQAYSFSEAWKMGTFPKPGEDHNKAFNGGDLDAFLDVCSCALMPFKIYVCG